MSIVSTVLIAATAFVLGALIIWIWCARAIGKIQAKIPPLETEIFSLRPLKAELEAARITMTEVEKSLASATTRVEHTTAIEGELSDARQRVNDLTADVASLTAKHAAATQAHKDQIEQLTNLRKEVQDQFKLLANDALRLNTENFSKHASQLFSHHKELTIKDVNSLVGPLGETLKAYDIALKEIEKARVSGYSELGTTLKALNAQNSEVRDVTANLVNALRASPKTRGRWAENTLKRVMELSGLVEHCDFETEKHFSGEDESFRPDVVIQIAENRTIIVDAKAPTSAYLDAIEAITEEDRENHLKRHARQLRERLSDLSAKSYWQKIPGSTDCVVMFVPGDNFVSAAFEYDEDLFEDGFKHRVLICSPTTFIALAKALGYGWRQEKLAASAIEVAKIGRELYARLGKMAEYIGLLGGHLRDSVNSYNRFVGNLESRVLPSARRFSELGLEGAREEIPELTAVDTVVRPVGEEVSKLSPPNPEIDGET
ncbi:MAG TPA: DNA recombination protein RmuC [Rhizomicrobium sp.]|nr:DNA recombination protein RmuC [Rhizomicrobium sp.]